MKTWIRTHQLITFFVLAYALQYGAYFGHIWLRPGQEVPFFTPVWFIGVFSPTISAAFVAWMSGGTVELKRLFSGFTRWKVGWFWYLAALFIIWAPMVMALVYVAIGNPPVGLRVGWTVPMLLLQIFYQLFSGPLSEEAGWRGFALPRLESKYNALISSLILGVIWTFWHLPLFYLVGQAQMGIPMPLNLLLVVTITTYLTWLYNNTRGSLVITVLAHWSFNLTGTIITGPLSLMPAMVFYMTSGPLLFLAVVGIVIYFKPKFLSLKPASELPFQKTQMERPHLAV
jgi:membrane protease YdiL (CAAX protease family)